VCIQQEIKFQFINPLWAWVVAANEMRDAGYVMQFDPMSMFHEQTGEQLYGAGVAFGDALKFATARTPKNAKPALFGLSFDGGGSGVSNRTVYPISLEPNTYVGPPT